MLCIRYVPRMIKDHNLVPNQEARLCTIQKHKLQALVCWSKDNQCRGLEINADTWNTSDLTSSITHINIESPLGGYIKLAHPGKLEKGKK